VDQVGGRESRADWYATQLAIPRWRRGSEIGEGLSGALAGLQRLSANRMMVELIVTGPEDGKCQR
jgi:hypothetical protein